MKVFKGVIFSLLISSIFFSKIILAKENYMNNSDVKKVKHIVLLGASVGDGWDFPKLSQRVGNNDYTFEFVRVYAFDKTEELRKILHRSINKPEAIIIKECAAYFPGNNEEFSSTIKKWIQECRDNNVKPILATVVPVTRFHMLKGNIKSILKKSNPWKSSRIKSILDFNKWIRIYAKEQGLLVLDLENVVRENTRSGYLREDLDSGDGLHLNEKAYRLLDQIVIPVLNGE